MEETARLSPEISKKYLDNPKLLLFLLATGLLISYAVIVVIGKLFDYSLQLQSVILSSFFYGYALTQLLGGILADKYGGENVLLVAASLWSLSTLFTPLSLNYFGWLGLIFMRFILGFSEGSSFPACYSIIALNIKPEYRNRAVAILSSAAYAGSPLASLLSAPLATDTDWPWVFYYFGGVGLIWCMIWYLHNTKQPVNYITLPEDDTTQEPTEGPVKFSQIKRVLFDEIPWSDILSSKPVLNLMINQFCTAWSFYVLLSLLPTFLKMKFGTDPTKLGVYAAFPYAAQGIFGLIAGFSADHLIAKRTIPLYKIRWYFHLAGMILPSIFLLVTAYLAPTINLAVAALTITMGTSGLTLVSISSYQYDIDPNRAGLLYAIGNTVATLTGVIALPISAYLANLDESWALVFLVAAGLRLVGVTVWYYWGKIETNYTN